MKNKQSLKRRSDPLKDKKHRVVNHKEKKNLIFNHHQMSRINLVIDENNKINNHRSKNRNKLKKLNRNLNRKNKTIKRNSEQRRNQTHQLFKLLQMKDRLIMTFIVKLDQYTSILPFKLNFVIYYSFSSSFTFILIKFKT